MTTHGHDHSSEADDDLLHPSANIATGVRWLILGTIVLAILQGSFVVGSARDLHTWPSEDSTKVVLPPYNPSP